MSEESAPLRLRPKLAGDSPAAPAVAPSASAAATPPLVPVLNPPAPVASSTTPDFAARAQKVQRAALLILAAGVVVFAAVAYVAFPRIRAMEKAFLAEESSSAEENSAPASAPRSTPPPAASTPSSTAAATSPTPAPAARPAIPSAAIATTPAPTPAHETTSSPASDGPSVAFRAWVQDVKITGLRTGESPRVLLGRSSFNVGDIVHPELGIVFDGYDPARRMLRFKDATGATLERRHP